MKRAFIVVGAESSGNRLMARILIAAGCHGNGTTDQPSIEEICKSGADDIVIHRSFPYGMKGSGRHWPKLSQIHDEVIECGYLPEMYIVMVRDEFCSSRSAMKNHHIESAGSAINEHVVAYNKIFGDIVNFGLPFMIVPYEALILGQQNAVNYTLAQLYLRQIDLDEEIRNENAKYY